MAVCLVCGITHGEKIGDDVFQIYLNASSRLLFRNLRKAIDIQSLPAPLCAECVEEFRSWLDKRMPLMAAEFGVHVLSARLKHQSIRDGLERARREGKRIGRPAKHSEELKNKAFNLREQGMSYRRISDFLGLAGGTVARRIVERVRAERRWESGGHRGAHQVHQAGVL